MFTVEVMHDKIPPRGFATFDLFDERSRPNPVHDLGRLNGRAFAVIGILVLSLVAGLLVAVTTAPALGVTGELTAASTSVFRELPSYIDVGRLPERNKIFANGPKGTTVQIATVYDQNREELPWSKISPYLKDAAVDGEDKDFYSHGGVDVESLVRALVGNVASGEISSGASTIAMQVVRDVQIEEASELSTPAEQTAAYKAATEDTVNRKLREMKLAIGLEKTYSKQDILLAYLNIANFGHANYGVDAASEAYFSTSASTLTPAQAASLIAIVQSPSARNLGTATDYTANETRRDFILNQMYADGDITKAQLTKALATKVDASFVKLSKSKNGCLAAPSDERWMCEYVVDSVPENTALGSTVAEREKNWKLGGYSIYTTLNMGMQSVASGVLRSYVPAGEAAFRLGGAVSTVQPGTGDILVMAENKSFNDTQTGSRSTTAVNFNVDEAEGGSVGFQPGSSYKLFTLLAWLEKGYGLNAILNASVRQLSEASFPDSCGDSGNQIYKFTNDENEQGGTTVTRATARSINSVFLQMATKLDMCKITQIATSLGVHNANGSPLSKLPSCVIGGCTNTIAPLTMAAAYAAIANNGVYCSPIAVRKIVSAAGKDLGGEAANCHQAIPKNIAHTAAQALLGPLSSAGTGAAANPNDGTALAGKTGTTNNSLQTWTVASSTKASTAVWIGNISGSQPLRTIAVSGMQAALLRNVVYRTVMAYIDSRVGGASSFPAADPALLSNKGGSYIATAPTTTPTKHKPPAVPPPTTPPDPGG